MLTCIANQLCPALFERVQLLAKALKSYLSFVLYCDTRSDVVLLSVCCLGPLAAVCWQRHPDHL